MKYKFYYLILFSFWACEKTDSCDNGCYEVSASIANQSLEIKKPYADPAYPYITCHCRYSIIGQSTDSILLHHYSNIVLESGEELLVGLVTMVAYSDLDSTQSDSIIQYTFDNTVVQRFYFQNLGNKFLSSVISNISANGLLLTYKNKAGDYWSTANYANNLPSSDINSDTRYTFTITDLKESLIYLPYLDKELEGFIASYDIKATLYNTNGQQVDFSGTFKLPLCSNYR